MSFSSLLPNPHRPSEAKDEAAQQQFIDTLLSYRRKETLLAVAVLWLTVLVMVFSLVLTVGVALRLPALLHVGS